MYDTHRRAIQRLTDTFRDDPRFLAVIIGGSVAKGRAAENGDVDIMLVATDEEFARHVAAQNFGYFNTELCDYPDGYIDGKIIDLQFLRDVAEKGSEPARSAFVGAFPVCSRIPELETLIKRILVYPEAQREAKMKSFFSQVMLLNWYVGEAEKRSDAYLMMRMASSLVLFGSRLILAYNRILYPYHKWLMYELRQAPDRPADLIAVTDALLAHPGKASAQTYFDCLNGFRDWGVTFPEAIAHFTRDSEWNWRNGQTPLEDW